MRFQSILGLVAAISFAVPVLAQDYKAGDLRIERPYARATAPKQPTGAAYVSIENTGKSTDKLKGASSPVAKKVELHTMSMAGNVMKMREVNAIEIPASGKLAMKPGDGYHLMLMGLKQPLKVGEKFPLTLDFEKAGKVEVSVTIEDKPAGEHAHGQGKH